MTYFMAVRPTATACKPDKSAQPSFLRCLVGVRQGAPDGRSKPRPVARPGPGAVTVQSKAARTARCYSAGSPTCNTCELVARDSLECSARAAHVVRGWLHRRPTPALVACAPESLRRRPVHFTAPLGSVPRRGLGSDQLRRPAEDRAQVREVAR